MCRDGAQAASARRRARRSTMPRRRKRASAGVLAGPAAWILPARGRGGETDATEQRRKEGNCRAAGEEALRPPVSWEVHERPDGPRTLAHAGPSSPREAHRRAGPGRPERSSAAEEAEAGDAAG